MLGKNSFAGKYLTNFSLFTFFTILKYGKNFIRENPGSAWKIIKQQQQNYWNQQTNPQKLFKVSKLNKYYQNFHLKFSLKFSHLSWKLFFPGYEQEQRVVAVANNKIASSLDCDCASQQGKNVEEKRALCLFVVRCCCCWMAFREIAT